MNAIQPVDPLAEALDQHWLYQGIETGVALCTCGKWSFDAKSGQHPLPVMGERFAPFSHHVADAIRALTTANVGLVHEHGPLSWTEDGWRCDVCRKAPVVIQP